MTSPIEQPGPTRLALPKPRPAMPTQKPKPRDELASIVVTMAEVGSLVRRMREGLKIRQDELATRAKVGRHWIVELEQGKPTLEADRVLRVLRTLGFELVLSPYDPAPPWMLRAMRDAQAKRKTVAAGRTARRRTRRGQARAARLAANEVWVREDVE